MEKVLFVDDINKEFCKLLRMKRELEKGKSTFIESWEKLGIPWTDQDRDRLIYLYETSESYLKAEEEISQQLWRMIDYLVSNGVKEEVVNAMLWKF